MVILSECTHQYQLVFKLQNHLLYVSLKKFKKVSYDFSDLVFQTVTNVYIANLALSDVILAMFCIPFQETEYSALYRVYLSSI
jgi:hypothetical protein